MDETERSIGLIGFMATGKTTVGLQLAKTLDREFLDTDSIIEKTTGKTISEILSQSDDSYFRALESEVLQEVCNRQSAVISFGGGAPLNPSNADIIRANTVVVLLRSSIDTLVSRISRNELRPLLAGAGDNLKERIVTMYAAREIIYTAVADIVIDTDEKSPAHTATEIIRRLGL